MKLQDDQDLRASIETLARMYRHRDRCASDTHGYPEARAVVVESVKAQIRQIEQDLFEYLLQRTQIEKPEYMRTTAA